MDTYRLQQSQQKNLHSDPTQLHELPCLKKEVSFYTLTGHELEKFYNGKYVFPSTSKNTVLPEIQAIFKNTSKE